MIPGIRLLICLCLVFACPLLCQGQPQTDDLQEATENVRKNPASSEARVLLGSAYAAAGRYDEARASFQEAVALDPSYAEAHYGLGAVYFLQDNGFAFLDEYGILKTLDPKMAEKLYSILSEKRVPSPLIAKKAPEPAPPVVTPKEEAVVPEKPVPVPHREAVPVKDNYYAVQLGFFSIKDNAVSLVREMVEKGYDSFLYEEEKGGDKTGYRVLIGRYAARAEAESAAENIARKEKTAPLVYFVTKSPKPR